MYREKSASGTSQNTVCSWPLPATRPRAAEGSAPRLGSAYLTVSAASTSLSGRNRQPIGYGDPQNEEIESDRQHFRGSEEAHHQDEREDGSCRSQTPPPAKRYPPSHHRQRREDKQQCRTPTQPDPVDRVLAGSRDSAQETAVAYRPGPSPP